MSVISMKQLLEAGVHFGHQTRRWNPKMAPYIYTERNGIYIIDLQKSVGKVDEAYKAMAEYLFFSFCLYAFAFLPSLTGFYSLQKYPGRHAWKSYFFPSAAISAIAL